MYAYKGVSGATAKQIFHGVLMPASALCEVDSYMALSINTLTLLKHH